MQQSTKFLLCTLVYLTLSGTTAIAIEIQAITAQAEKQPAPAQLATDFPTLDSAIAEIKRLNYQISAIEAPYETQYAQPRKLAIQKYAVQFSTLADEISALRDESESLADFDVRREKQRAWINFQRNAEMLGLSASVLAASETAPLRARIDALEKYEYVFGRESLKVELDEYDAKNRQYPIFVLSKTPSFQLRLKGNIPLPPAEAETFQKQWQAGLIRPEVKVQVISESPELTFINDADNTRLTFIDGTFMTAIARQEKMERKYRPEMITIPAGGFDMGSNGNMPVHRVTFVKNFAISKTEVTQGQWYALMGNASIRINNCGDKCPVENISWNDAQDFIRKLNAKTGKQYRLPSEAEWEYACRAGVKQEFCGSDTVDLVAWYSRNSGSVVHPVAAKQANAFGLHDMSGNVWEWVEDSYHDNYKGAPRGGEAWQGDGTMRVVRGGSRSDGELSVRASARDGFEPEYHFNGFGFRLARTLP